MTQTFYLGISKSENVANQMLILVDRRLQY